MTSLENRSAFRTWILGLVGRVVKLSTLTRNHSKEGFAYTQVPPVDQEEGEEDTQEPVRKVQWFGFRSKPPEGSDAVILAARASNSQKVLVACDNLGFGPTDLQDGESTVFNQFDAIIRLDKDGNITLVPKAGAKVRLGSGQAGQLDAVALFTKLKADFDAFVSVFNGHTHSAPGGATGNPSAAASGLSASVASENVQAKKP